MFASFFSVGVNQKPRAENVCSRSSAMIVSKSFLFLELNGEKRH